MSILINWILSAIAILVSAYIVPGVAVGGFLAALILAVILGAINAVIKPILIVLTLPINVLTLGLFTLVINAILIMLADLISPGFTVSSFWSAMLFSVVLAVVNWVVFALFK